MALKTDKSGEYYTWSKLLFSICILNHNLNAILLLDFKPFPYIPKLSSVWKGRQLAFQCTAPT